MSIGERISTLRKEQKLSQGQLAKALDVTRQAVSKWENNLSAPDSLKLIQLSELLKTDVEYLTTGNHPEPAAPAPVVVNVVKKVDQVKVVEKVIEKPVVKRIVRVKYLRNPIEFLLLGVICFAAGVGVGMLL